jgi:hypothetical protein
MTINYDSFILWVQYLLLVVVQVADIPGFVSEESAIFHPPNWVGLVNLPVQGGLEVI